MVSKNIRLKIDVVNSHNEMLSYTRFDMNNKSEAINKFINFINKNEMQIFKREI